MFGILLNIVQVKWLYCHSNHVQWYSTQFLQGHGATYDI